MQTLHALTELSALLSSNRDEKSFNASDVSLKNEERTSRVARTAEWREAASPRAPRLNAA